MRYQIFVFAITAVMSKLLDENVELFSVKEISYHLKKYGFFFTLYKENKGKANIKTVAILNLLYGF